MNPMSKINLRSGQFKGQLAYYTSKESKPLGILLNRMWLENSVEVYFLRYLLHNSITSNHLIIFLQFIVF